MQGLSLQHVVGDPRFESNRDRLANAEALDAEIQAAVGELPLDRVLAIGEEVEAPIGPVNEIDAIFADPHIRDRRNIASVEDEELGPIRMQGVVPRLTETPGQIAHAGPRHRAYNRDVYTGLLGLDEETLRDLEARGVV
jgi:crotonobetainyl-CoA:carnitine CoA-transferase CaiB-like acyl-CoA transferase